MGEGEHADEAPRKKVKSKAKDRKNSYWSSIKSWTAAEVADTFLLGAEEGGFAGLEILEDPTILENLPLTGASGRDETVDGKNSKASGKEKKKKKAKGSQQEADEQPGEASLVNGNEGDKKKKKRKQREEGVQEGTVGGDEGEAPQAKKKKKQRQKKRKSMQEVERSALMARVLELERENNALKSQQGGEEAGVDTAKAPARKAKTAAAEAPMVDMSSWKPYTLHPTVLTALSRLGFAEPTPIQAACLPAAIEHKRDIIGAAQTGSGKTLAFALPILHQLALERESAAGEERQGEGETAPRPLKALILTPTRELALQVCSHMQAIGAVCRVRVAAIVGGLAAVKQERLLRGCPPVVVATPGRLWELMGAGHTHLAKLEGLAFFVLDEADRMVQQGHFQELSHILDLLPRPGRCDPSQDEEVDGFADDKPSRLLKRVTRKLDKKRRGRGEEDGGDYNDDAGDDNGDAGKDNVDARDDNGDVRDDNVDAGDDNVDAGDDNDNAGDDNNTAGDDNDNAGDDNEDSASGEADGSDDEGEREEVNGDSQKGQKQGGGSIKHNQPEEVKGAEQNQQNGDQQNGDQQNGDQQTLTSPGGEVKRKRHMLQTFVFSATLTVPAALRKRMKKRIGGSAGSASLEALMDRISFRGRPAVVDLTPAHKLAETVQEAQIQCLDEERDSLLYYLLACHPGRTIVFANAVSTIRRLAALLRTLGMPAHALHAQQQQRQRLKALDNFRTRPDSILVATDVAARGLDVKDVTTVVHFHLPPSVDTYIHRCGRTGRMAADGVSIVLVTPKEAPRFTTLCQSLGRPPPPTFPVDAQVLRQADRRWNIAMKIDSIEHQVKKTKADRTWAQKTAALAELDVSENELDSDDQLDDSKLRGLDPREAAIRSGRLNAAAAKPLHAQLTQLLAQPLQPKVSRSFFTGSAALTSGVHSGPAPVALAGRIVALKNESKAKVDPKAVAASKQKLQKKAKQDPQAARLALARGLLKKKADKKSGKLKPQQRGMVVISQNMARNMHAPNAMEALRRKMDAAE